MAVKMATMLATAAARRARLTSLQTPRKMLSTAVASAAPASSGPPFKRYFLYTTAIMLGVPGAIGAVFVHNLKTDDEFYNHFNDRYPDLIAAINSYYSLDSQEAVDFASRTDIGPITPTSELLDETVTVVAELQSRLRVRFQVKGDTSEEEITKIALSHSQSPGDRVVSITIDEDAPAESDAGAVVVESSVSHRRPAFDQATTAPGVVAPPRPGVGWKRLPTAADKSVAELRAEIEALRVQQAALEESKFAGRDVDEADDEIRALEARKAELKALLPRKRFLYIF